MPVEHVAIEAHLHKEGDGGFRWHRRYFVLSYTSHSAPGNLRAYATRLAYDAAKAGAPDALILTLPLKNATITATSEPRPNHHAFRLNLATATGANSQRKKLILAAPSEGEALQWMSALANHGATNHYPKRPHEVAAARSSRAMRSGAASTPKSDARAGTKATRTPLRSGRGGGLETASSTPSPLSACSGFSQLLAAACVLGALAAGVYYYVDQQPGGHELLQNKTAAARWWLGHELDALADAERGALNASGEMEQEFESQFVAQEVRTQEWLAHEAFRAYEDGEGRLARWLFHDAGNGSTCSDGLVIPGPRMTGLNALICMVLLLWTFLGVAMAADVFMTAIEMVTSREHTRKILVDGEPRLLSLKVWNATVANLTLMALGSSAPEILLSLIEVSSRGFYSGELGPSTIVGSAAFNLFVISAVCIASVEAPKRISDVGVFSVTAVFSVLAYVWLAAILIVISPNVVEPWEAGVTLALFPLLVLMAYAADVGLFSCRGGSSSGSRSVVVGFKKDGKPLLRSEVSRALQSVDPTLVKELADEDLAKTVASSLGEARSRAFYRVRAVREATGGAITRMLAPVVQLAGVDARPVTLVHLSFEKRGYAFPEGGGHATLQVERTAAPGVSEADALDWEGSVAFRTRQGTATAGLDYVSKSGSLHFRRGQRLATVSVELIDDDEPEDDEVFFVELYEPADGASLGRYPVADVTIIDDDGPGRIEFVLVETKVRESAQTVRLELKRTRGVQGRVTLQYRTIDGTAIATKDYGAAKGRVTFEPGVNKATIDIEIIDDQNFEEEEYFYVALESPSNGATLGMRDRATVIIENDDERRKLVDSIAAKLSLNVHSLELAGASWCEQIREAVTFEPPQPQAGTRAIGAPPSGFTGRCALAFSGYALALPWKVAFALIPPPRVAGGWLCFIVSLAVIGGLTAIIGDLAEHMGCCLGIQSSITAITIVALGTSMPDTFASRHAAVKEKDADSSIGNITGSNSVNVFLGLGLPWLLAALYWHSDRGLAQEESWRARYRGEPWYSEEMPVSFVVPSGDLGFSVAVFSILAIVGLLLLVLRRFVAGGELGGSAIGRNLSGVIFVGMWIVYIVASIARVNDSPWLMEWLATLPKAVRELVGVP